MNIKFSIITPNYNGERFLERTLKSILQQKEDGIDLELIVVDGMSKDGSIRILEKYAEEITHTIIEKDNGPANAINKGFALASGDVVAWLNADDIYYPGALKRVRQQFLKKNTIAGCFGKCPIIDENDQEIRQFITKFKEFFFSISSRSTIQAINYISQPALFFSRQALMQAGNLRENMVAAWDYEFILRLWRQGEVVEVPGGPLSAFRWHNESISGLHFRTQFKEELEVAATDAGRFAFQTIIHHGVRWGIICAYNLMRFARNIRQPPWHHASRIFPSDAHTWHLGVNTLFHVPGDIGGTETYLREMLFAIAEKFPELRLTLFTSLDNDALLGKLFGSYPNVIIRCLPFRAANRPLRIIFEQLWLPFAVRGVDVDVLWSPGYTAPFWVRCPQVVTIHDLQYKSHPDDLTWLEKTTLDVLVRMACKNCTSIIAVSQFSKCEIVKNGFALVDKITAVQEGVDSSFAEVVQASAVADELQKVLSSAKPFILCVAHTYPHKNVHLLIEAFSLICKEIPHSLVIIGKERLGEPAVQKSVDRLPSPERLIRMKDGVSFAVLKYLYQNADVFVLPSAYEGFGLPVLEAMMAGTLVVTSRMASLPEVAGDHAFYFQADDIDSLGKTMRAVIEMEPEKKNIWCDQAKSWAENFTWEKAAVETVDVLAACRKLK